MAYTGTIIRQSVHGNSRVAYMNVTADAASGAVDTGLGVVDAVAMAPISCATAAFKITINTNSGSTALNGSIKFAAAASGDNFYLIVHGR